MPPEPKPPVTDTTGQPSWMAPVKPVVPDHELLRRIGGGSYGDVWLARTTVGTWRAVKVVFRDRFTDARPYEREFNGMQKFEPLSRSNEGFIDILQIGRNDAEGYFYYVMELADDASLDTGCQILDAGHAAPANATGESNIRRQDSSIQHPASSIQHPDSYVPKTLAKVLLQRGRLPLGECLELGVTLNLGLAHLHRASLIHRDIKPSNLIFVGGVPKLADIGLVIETAEARSYVGTEGFIPPEGPNSPQADLYSLGKVLYEAGMGKDRKDFPEPFTQIIDAPDSAQLLEFNAILLKACAANVKERYQSAEEMNADLALLQSGGSVRRQRKLAGQLRFVQRAGAIVTALAAVIALGWWWQAKQTRVVRILAAEKTQLAKEKTQLAEEGRQRIVRLDVANGIRLLDDGDPAGALLWFADALPLVTNNAAEESIHRIRIQRTLDQTPRVLRVFPHESMVHSAAFSPDGRFVATGTRDGNLRVWKATDVSLVWGPKAMGTDVAFVRFSHDGRRLFASSTVEQWAFNGGVGSRNFHTVLEVGSGREVFPALEADSGVSTNLICSHFSPDDRWLATAQKDNRIRVFDLADGRLVTELRGHTGEVRFLSFSADGSLLASASLDRTVRLWRLPSGEPVGSPLAHRLPVVRALLAGDGQHVITASFPNPGGFGNATSQAGEGEVLAWKVATAQRLGDPIRWQDWLVMYLNPAKPKHFYAIDHAYDFDSPAEPLFKLEAGAVQSWDFSRDNSRVALGEAGNAARIFDATTGKLVAGPFPHAGEVSAIQFSPDERFLLTGSGDGNARLWDLRPVSTDSARRTLPAAMQQIDAVALGAQVGRSGGRTPIFMADGLGLWLFDDQLEEVLRLRKSESGMKFSGIQSAWNSNLWISWRFEPDSKALVLYRPKGNDPCGVLLEHPEEVTANVITRDDRFIITSCRDGTIRYWRTSDGGLQKSVTIPDAGNGWVPGICPDGRTAIWAPQNLDERPVFRIVDLESGKFVGAPRALPKGAMLQIRYAPDGKQFAIWEFMGAVTVMETRTGQVISSSIQHSGNLSWIEWAPDCRRLLTAGQNEEVLVWDVRTGSQLFGPLQTPGAANRVARWSHDGRFIVTRNDDKNVRVWDVATGEAVTPLLRHSGDVAFAFLTQSNRLITATHPDLLRAWDLKESLLPLDVLTDYAKLLSGRRLGTTGARLTVKPEELAELDRSLRTRAPQLFE